MFGGCCETGANRRASNHFEELWFRGQSKDHLDRTQPIEACSTVSRRIPYTLAHLGSIPCATHTANG
jgi:hypothetical protein